MQFPELKEATQKLNAKRTELRNVLQEARNDAGEYDPKQLTSIDLPDGVALRDWVQTQTKEIDELQDKVEDLKGQKALAEFASADPDMVEGSGPERTKRESIGEAFVASDAYRNKGQKATLDLDIRNTLFERSAGWNPESTRTGYVDLSPERRPAVIDYIPQIPWSQAAVKFMRETTFTDTNVVEKAEGNTFGEAALALTEQSVTVEKVPAWLPVTDEQLEDVDGAEEYVTSRLTLMVRKRVDLQLLQGDGITPNLEGTENVTGIQTQAIGTDDIPDGLYKLFVKIMDDNDNSGGDADPSVVFIRAAKWQTVALMRTADGIYIWGNPADGGPLRSWGVPVVLTNAVTATKAVTGDYATHSYVAVRRGVDVQVTNSHSDFFINGKQAIRADVRLAMVHLRPSAFGELTGL